MPLPSTASPETIAAALAANPDLACHTAKLHDVPSHVNAWMQASGGLQGRRVLEFGCECGLISAGIALGYAPEVVYGVDPLLKDALPDVLASMDLQMPGNLVLQRQARVTDLPELSFDVVFAWSALPRLDLRTLTEVIAAMYRATTIGGRVLLQAQQLFFSIDGARLREYGIAPWGHLSMSRLELRDIVLSRMGNDNAAAISALDRADNLPRIGSGTLAGLFQDAGFHLVRRYVTRVAELPPLALTEVFQPDALTENQVLLLFSKN